MQQHLTFDLPHDTPKNIKLLPRDPRGFPVPFFVAVKPDGMPDLRFACQHKQQLCYAKRLCWVCGKKLKATQALIGGPLSVMNQRFSDMPSHPTCAEFSAKYCPHLNNSRARYRDNDKPGNIVEPTGSVSQHPGVAAITYCRDSIRLTRGNELFVKALGILRIQWWYDGKEIDAQAAAELYSPPNDMPQVLVHALRQGIKHTADIPVVTNKGETA